MKVSQLLPAAGLVAFAQAWETDASTVYTTVVTTAYETYCPAAPVHHDQDDLPSPGRKHHRGPAAGRQHNHQDHQDDPATQADVPQHHRDRAHPKPPKTTEHPPHPDETVTPKPPKPSHHANLTSTVVVVVTPPAVTTIGHTTPVTPTTPVTELPTKTPVGPSTTRPVTVPGSGAGALAASAGAAVLAGVFALLI
ncbi:hypothetical protein ColLi_04935 [Colletotrichum liriopes]|uniref:GPI anchored serine-rich protein n=1 Tax=Colletotrichum liriopes TaxID=708192 RepID=A0AA37GKH3_9PEZI|nr:hypothetical protein ColLi_04935 [Colletotrichum liriopes]